jgi:hypothetical protein
MAKKVTETLNDTFEVGIDIGYGVTNVVWAYGRDKFPSITGRAQEISYQVDEITKKYPGQQLSDDDGDWFVGDLAAAQLTDNLINRLYGRGGNEGINHTHRLRLVKVGLARAIDFERQNKRMKLRNGDMVRVYLSVGLPVSHFKESASALKMSLVGQHKVHTDLGHFVVDIAHIEVTPEPYGCVYAHRFLPTGEMNLMFLPEKIAVVNVGTVTIDVFGDDDGEPMNDVKGSVEGGLIVAKTHLFDYLNSRYNHAPKWEMVEDLLRNKHVRAPGDKQADKQGYVNMAVEWQIAINPVADATVGLMVRTIKADYYLDAILLTGGGAYPVLNAVKSHFSRTQISQDPEFDTAQGYFNILRYTAILNGDGTDGKT